MGRKAKNNLPEIHNVEFHDQILQTVVKDGIQYVAMKRIVESIGMDWKNQHVKLTSQKERFNYGDITIVGGDGKNRQMGCIPLNKLNSWLFTINPAKIPDPEVRERVILYQEECSMVLFNYWQKGAAINSRFFDENSGVGLMDESARNSNLVHYSVAGLCREADRFLGGKAALKALNFFTGMPVEDLLKDLEESKKEKEACGVTGFTSRPPATVLEFISSHCSFGPDKTVTKNELYQAYLDYCESNGEKPEIRSMFFKVLMNHPKAGINARHCRKGNGAGSRYFALIGIGLKEVVED